MKESLRSQISPETLSSAHEWSLYIARLVADQLQRFRTWVGVESLFEQLLTCAERQISAEGPGLKLACAPGCAACCKTRIDVTPLELFVLSAQLERRHDYEAIRERVRLRAAEIRMYRRPNERFLRQVPCGVLTPKDGCDEYQRRPFTCRAETSLDSSLCGPPLRMKFQSGQIKTVYAALTDGIVWGLKAAGLDYGFAELTLGLELLFRRPELRDQWLAGKPVLDGVRSPDVAVQAQRERSAVKKALRLRVVR